MSPPVRRASTALATMFVVLVAAGCGSSPGTELVGSSGRTSAGTEPSQPARPPATTAPVPTVEIAGTGLAIPIPPTDLGSDQSPVEIDARDQGFVAHGWTWDVPGLVEGGRMGGTSVVFADSEVSRSGDIAAIAADANSDVKEYEVEQRSGLPVISWPTSDEHVPGYGPYADRPVQRFVIVLPSGRLDVVFDSIAPEAASAYLDLLTKAVSP